MTWHRWFLLIGAVSGLAICNVTTVAESQRIGLPAGYYKIPAGGRLRIPGYCMDQNLPAPAADLTVIPLNGDEDKFVSLKGASAVGLTQALADKMLVFKTQERTLNQYLELCEHVGDDQTVLDGVLMFKLKFDPPDTDSETGRLRKKFGELPLSEAMQKIHQDRVQAGAAPDSITSGISLTKQVDGPFKVIRTDGDSTVPAPMIFVDEADVDPRQIELGATITNETHSPMLLELGTPLILATDKKRRLDKIDLANIKTAKGFVGRKQTQHQIWVANETLAAAHCRDFQQYQARFDQMPDNRGKIVKGLMHDRDASLVFVDTGEVLEVRRVSSDKWETIQRGPDAEKAFEKLPLRDRGDREAPLPKVPHPKPSRPWHPSHKSS